MGSPVAPPTAVKQDGATWWLRCRRVGDLAAAAVRGQLNLLPSTAAARNTVNQQQQQQCTAAVGEENTPPEEQAAVLQALLKTQARAAAAAAKQQQPGRGTIQPPRPLAAAAIPVLTWEEQLMGRPGAGIAWGGDRRKLKNDKIRTEKQQTAEERARKKAEREQRETQQKAARKLLKEQERARREEEKKAAEAARRAEAKAARVGPAVTVIVRDYRCVVGQLLPSATACHHHSRHTPCDLVICSQQTTTPIIVGRPLTGPRWKFGHQ